MKMSEYLGRPSSTLLEAQPFKGWSVERTFDEDNDSPIARYSFGSRPLRFNSDGDDERVRTVFLQADEHDGTVLSDIPFDSTRAQVLARFGAPSKSGDRRSDPILGSYGPWDRFQLSSFVLHVQFRYDSDSVAMVTLMRNDVAP